jgi:hypothetical protein
MTHWSENNIRWKELQSVGRKDSKVTACRAFSFEGLFIVVVCKCMYMRVCMGVLVDMVS